MEEFEETIQLWKTWDKAADKNGQRGTVYWVKKNAKFEESTKMGAKQLPSRFETGALYTGGWKENKREGFGSYTWINGNKYEGEWHQDKRQGKGTFWVKQGSKLQKRYTGDWHMDHKEVLFLSFFFSPPFHLWKNQNAFTFFLFLFLFLFINDHFSFLSIKIFITICSISNQLWQCDI